MNVDFPHSPLLCNNAVKTHFLICLLKMTFHARKNQNEFGTNALTDTIRWKMSYFHKKLFFSWVVRSLSHCFSLMLVSCVHRSQKRKPLLFKKEMKKSGVNNGTKIILCVWKYIVKSKLIKTMPSSSLCQKFLQTRKLKALSCGRKTFVHPMVFH